MVRQSKGVYSQYSHQKLADALHAVRTGRASANAAAKAYGVPRSTIGDYMRDNRDDKSKSGRGPVVPKDIEDEVVNHILQAAERGFGVTRQQLLHKVGRMCQTVGLKTPFAGGIPGKFWWEGFKQRHPEVTLRTPEALSTCRARCMNSVVVGRYFMELESIMRENGLMGKPHLIWNADESGVQFCHRPVKVCARVGSRNVPGRVGTSRDSVTMMCSINASGTVMPPLFITKGKTRKCLDLYKTSEAPEGSCFSFQKNAWMEDILATEWFENVFLRHCGQERPQLLLWDSHHSHETLEVLQKAKQNDIIVMAFPPHTTHHLCPLDRCLFGPFKKQWNSVCSEFLQENPQNTINKQSFCGLVKQAFDQSFTRSNIVSGFESSGICKWNPLAISLTAFSPSEPSNIHPDDAGTDAQPLPSDSHPLDWVLREKTSQVATTVDVHHVQAEVHASNTPLVSEANVPNRNINDVPVEVVPSLDNDIEVVSNQPLSLVPVEMLFPDGSTQLVYVESSHIEPAADATEGTPHSITSNVHPNQQNATAAEGGSTWKGAVEKEFGTNLTNQMNHPDKPAAGKRKVTHRVLTSDEIIMEKENESNKKKKTLIMKEERKRKQEEKKRVNNTAARMCKKRLNLNNSTPKTTPQTLDM